MKQDPKHIKTTQFMTRVEGDINANNLDYLYDDGEIIRSL